MILHRIRSNRRDAAPGWNVELLEGRTLLSGDGIPEGDAARREVGEFDSPAEIVFDVEAEEPLDGDQSPLDSELVDGVAPAETVMPPGITDDDWDARYPYVHPPLRVRDAFAALENGGGGVSDPSQPFRISSDVVRWPDASHIQAVRVAEGSNRIRVTFLYYFTHGVGYSPDGSVGLEVEGKSVKVGLDLTLTGFRHGMAYLCMMYRQSFTYEFELSEPGEYELSYFTLQRGQTEPGWVWTLNQVRVNPETLPVLNTEAALEWYKRGFLLRPVDGGAPTPEADPLTPETEPEAGPPGDVPDSTELPNEDSPEESLPLDSGEAAESPYDCPWLPADDQMFFELSEPDEPGPWDISSPDEFVIP